MDAVKYRIKCSQVVPSSTIPSTVSGGAVKRVDFSIGLEFLGPAGLRWRCTDVGSRTILAIQLDQDDPRWYEGPPYIAKEVVFDEQEIEHCHLTESDALKSAVREHKRSGHPGYPADAVRQMLKTRHAHRYPHEGVLRFDRCRPDGEILHPYAGRKVGESWMVDLYLPFLNTYAAMAELDFIALPRAKASDIRARSAVKNSSDHH